MELGRKIKELRTGKGLTQEALAAELSVTPQAVSKWETGATTPDIQLLPQLAIYFGVTMDELFCMTDDEELERIQNMIWDSRMLPQGELERAQRFLRGRIAADYRAGRCWELLAQLHNHQARQHHQLAAEYARQALEREPEEKDGHSEFNEAMGGVYADWCTHNHHRLIDYYQGFVKRHPEYPRGYLWLLDSLLADHRLTEAEAALRDLERVDDTFRVPLYRGLLYRTAGQEQRAQEVWTDMERNFPGDGKMLFALGDMAADRQQYDRALEYYRRAVECQAPPRYVDPFESMAQVYQIVGDIPGALSALREELTVLADDWQCTEGETVDKLRREIDRLEGLL